VLAIAAVGFLVLALMRAFPEVSHTPDDWGSIAYYALFLVLLAAGAGRLTRGALPQHLRHVAIWLAIVAVLALGFAYRDLLAEVPRRLQLAFGAGAPIATAERELVIPQNDEGAYVVVGKVNGQKVLFVVDTGATDTVLSPRDARRLGMPVDQLTYDGESETANGTGHSAPITADSLEVGPIRLQRFAMAVNQAPMSASLLGLSFLDRLESYEFRGRKLVLHWREG
jgi:aspartyl protease family protein